ncbi:protein MHF1 homolog isoform X2 [Bidens hawaiensis]|uniref:protein MHF1 homolog isoform X2 n=1 Tax=Bidens hawaiensis TaxID=980011 RepID=UPI00404A89D0
MWRKKTTTKKKPLLISETGFVFPPSLSLNPKLNETTWRFLNLLLFASPIWPLSMPLADDLELFAHHANRKIVNMNDVILSAHRNKHLAETLRSFSHDLKAKEPQSEKKRKKSSNKEDKAFNSVLHIDP